MRKWLLSTQIAPKDTWLVGGSGLNYTTTYTGLLKHIISRRAGVDASYPNFVRKRPSTTDQKRAAWKMKIPKPWTFVLRYNSSCLRCFVKTDMVATAWKTYGTFFVLFSDIHPRTYQARTFAALIKMCHFQEIPSHQCEKVGRIHHRFTHKVLTFRHGLCTREFDESFH